MARAPRTAPLKPPPNSTCPSSPSNPKHLIHTPSFVCFVHSLQGQVQVPCPSSRSNIRASCTLLAGVYLVSQSHSLLLPIFRHPHTTANFDHLDPLKPIQPLPDNQPQELYPKMDAHDVEVAETHDMVSTDETTESDTRHVSARFIALPRDSMVDVRLSDASIEPRPIPLHQDEQSKNPLPEGCSSGSRRRARDLE